MENSKRNIKEILEELFKGQESALYKYARVRITQYEINLWHKYGLPLKEVSRLEKQYFSKRFLGEKAITDVSEEELQKGLDALDHAVKDGCHGRCTKLVAELNEALAKKDLKPVTQVEQFLDWLTFSYEVRKDHEGKPIEEKPYGFEIRIFNSDENRKEFWYETKTILEQGRIMSMQDIANIVMFRRNHSKKL